MSEKEKNGKFPSEYYRLIVTRRVYKSKNKFMDVSAVFDWEDKADALAVKGLLEKANRPPLGKSSLISPRVKFKIVHPDEELV